MADMSVRRNDRANEDGIPRTKLVDLGDGTHADVVAIVGGGTGGAMPVEITEPVTVESITDPVKVEGPDGPVIVTPAGYDALGYQQISNATLASASALTVPTGATVAIVQNNGTQNARFRDDGTNPTTSTGQRLTSGGTLTYDASLSAIRFIREADGVTLDIAYYKPKS